MWKLNCVTLIIFMCRGRKIDETWQKYIFRLKALILRVSLFLLVVLFLTQFQIVNFLTLFITPCFSFFFFSHFLSSWSCTGKQDFLQLRDILLMLIDIRATSEAGKLENLFGGQKDLCQFFPPWRNALHPETGPSAPVGGPELNIDISNVNYS